MTLTLALIKKHLRIPSDQTDEDDLIAIYQGAAEGWVRNFLDDDDQVPDEPDVNAAILLIIADLYENREAQAVNVNINPNPRARNLLDPYRKKQGV